MINKINYNFQVNNINKKDETVLFLHGWGGSTNSFLCVQNEINNYYNTLNIDFNGFGKSNEPLKPFDTYLYALSVYELLKNLNINTIYIVSHSFGGRVAILLSSIFHIKVKKLILINSAGLKSKRSPFYYFKVYGYKFCKYLVKKNIISNKFLKHFGSSDYKALSKGMRQTFVNVVNQNLKEFLNKITVKTLIVWGDKDKTTPISFAKTFKQNIPCSRLVVFKGAGHFSYLDNLIEFNKLLIGFLEE